MAEGTPLEGREPALPHGDVLIPVRGRRGVAGAGHRVTETWRIEAHRSDPGTDTGGLFL